MKNIDNKTLSVLSLLIIPGILLMPVFWGSPLIILSILMSFIGGLSFGTLIGRNLNKK